MAMQGVCYVLDDLLGVRSKSSSDISERSPESDIHSLTNSDHYRARS